MKNFLKFSVALVIFVFSLLSLVKFNNTKYSYLDICKLKGSSIVRQMVYQGEDPLRTDNPEKSKVLNVPGFQLIYKEKAVNYFKELWQGYEAGSDGVTYTKEGVQYYKKNRAWRKAELISGKDTLKVKIRTHGIEPDGHHVGDYFSYQVKTINGQHYKGSSKFKLIIYERLGFYVDLLSFYHEKYDLLWAKPAELVKVNVNGTGNKLFYLEDYGIANRHQYKGYRRLSTYGYKSGVEILKPPTVWVKDGILQSDNDSIEKVDLLRLNQYLQDRDSIGMLTFFDEEYLIRYLVLKTILGYSGHECYPGNWYMYYDKTKRKFYPALSREPNLMTLNKNKNLLGNLTYYNHPVENRSSLRLNFYSIALANPSFYNRLKLKLKLTLANDRDEFITEWWKAKSYHENLVKGSAFLSMLKVDTKLQDIENNLEILENLLSERD